MFTAQGCSQGAYLISTTMDRCASNAIQLAKLAQQVLPQIALNVMVHFYLSLFLRAPLRLFHALAWLDTSWEVPKHASLVINLVKPAQDQGRITVSHAKVLNWGVSLVDLNVPVGAATLIWAINRLASNAILLVRSVKLQLLTAWLARMLLNPLVVAAVVPV